MNMQKNIRGTLKFTKNNHCTKDTYKKTGNSGMFLHLPGDRECSM